MNDTHEVNERGSYAFDLDGTLATYTEWKGIAHIGEPIKPMIDLIKKLHNEGKVVKILTARVSPRENPEEVDGKKAGDFIVEWCEKNLGFVPEITHQKDPTVLEFYDDRAKQVVPNKGLLIEDIARIQSEELLKCRGLFNVFDHENLRLQRKLDSKFNGFFAGMMLGTFFAAAIFITISIFSRSANLTKAEKNLHSAIHAYIEAKAN